MKLTRILRVREYRRALRYGAAATTEHESVAFEHEFRSVIDVGAHRGEFALFAARRFPGARLWCVEPLAEARERLRSVLAHVPDLDVLPVAAAEAPGRRTLHVSRQSAASSLLPLTATLAAAFPGTEETEVREVECQPLDAVFGLVQLRGSESLAPVPPTEPHNHAVSLDAEGLSGSEPQASLPAPRLLKIDVQGAELDVLRGAERLLGLVDEVFVESSFVELYEGQALAPDVIDFLHARGFVLTGVYSLLRDRTGRVLQADLLFGRRG